MSTRLDDTRLAAARSVADAILYEGYVLYPYRRSSDKNEVRWQFGVLPPRQWVEPHGPVTDSVAGSAEWWWQQTECLVEAPGDATLELTVRHLQLQARTVAEVRDDGSSSPVDRLEVDGRTELTFDEAVPQETVLSFRLDSLAAGEHTAQLSVPDAETTEELRDGDGRVKGVVRRRRWALAALVHVSVEPAGTPFPAKLLRVRVENALPGDPRQPRQVAMRHSLISTHCLMALDTGSFLSLLDPPEWATPATAACRNVRTFPVLAGPEGSDDTLLSSPIILYDHPRVAPESPGDLHDSGEIDEILTLRTMLLTEEEKHEARATDPRTAAIVDRVDTMPPEVLQKLHGVIRSLEPAARPETPWWEPEADASVDPATDAVVIDGVPVARGSRVRIHPRRRGTDAHDMFLAGRTAVVEAVLLDVDGSSHVAVTIEDDPSAELHQWYGRHHHYRPEELEPL
jgi:hypothetical protein